MGVKVFDFRWEDGQTILEVGYSLPGKVPFLDRTHNGSMSWTILDKHHFIEHQEEIKRIDPPYLRNKREKEQREKERREQIEKSKKETNVE